MHYSGYAFEGRKGEGKQAEIWMIFQEIKHLNRSEEHIKWSGGKSHYGRNSFSGICVSEEAKKLSDLDLLILADGGNLCFGGNCQKQKDGTFYGSYYTD